MLKKLDFTRNLRLVSVLAMLLVMMLGVMPVSHAINKPVLDIRAQQALQSFRHDVEGADAVLRKSVGILVFPRVYQGGFGIGGEYGQGELLIGGRVVDYYNIVSGSIGFQFGGQRKAIIIAFLDPKALQQFRNSEGWQIGADASVAVLTVGAEGSIDLHDLENKPIVGFVIDQKGLMYNLSLEGSKITRIK